MAYPDNFHGTLPGEDFSPGAAQREAQADADKAHTDACDEIMQACDFLATVWDVRVENTDPGTLAHAQAVAAALRAALAPFRPHRCGMSAAPAAPRHTPGPWTQDEAGVIRGINGDPVGEMVSRRPALTEAERVLADRHIMAAALDAIDAIRHVIQWHGELTRHDIARLKAIVAQAEGRSE